LRDTALTQKQLSEIAQRQGLWNFVVSKASERSLFTTRSDYIYTYIYAQLKLIYGHTDTDMAEKYSNGRICMVRIYTAYMFTYAVLANPTCTACTLYK
jgi:hypothetical protein